MHKLLENLKEVKSLYDDEFDLGRNGSSLILSNCIVAFWKSLKRGKRKTVTGKRR